ncbi:MAG: retroviral-like aspartic protease [Candidatus Rokubacteria bacterium]|nr:retroviral-like aspartic protease [Candidatus Rokubacteria bacterium]
MGMVIKRIRIRGDRGAVSVRALFDIGASRSLVRRDIARKVGRLLRGPRPWTFQLGDGKGKLQTNEMVGLVFQLQGVAILHTFIVARHLSEEVIIGTDLMQLWKIRPDPVREDVVIDKKLIQLKLV